MATESITIRSKKDGSITIRITLGHFATSHSHINYYVDMTDVKAQHEMAKQAAAELAGRHSATMIDTIICQEGTEMIGAYMADILSQPGTMTVNTGVNICVITPELNTSGQLIFRENTLWMVKDKNILLLLSSISKGTTAVRAINCIRYYAGRIVGVDALFSIVTEIGGVPVNSIFTGDDIGGYHAYSLEDCELCAGNRPIDAIVNGFGYSKL